MMGGGLSIGSVGGGSRSNRVKSKSPQLYFSVPLGLMVYNLPALPSGYTSYKVRARPQNLLTFEYPWRNVNGTLNWDNCKMGIAPGTGTAPFYLSAFSQSSYHQVVAVNGTKELGGTVHGPTSGVVPAGTPWDVPVLDPQADGVHWTITSASPSPGASFTLLKSSDGGNFFTIVTGLSSSATGIDTTGSFNGDFTSPAFDASQPAGETYYYILTNDTASAYSVPGEAVTGVKPSSFGPLGSTPVGGTSIDI